MPLQELYTDIYPSTDGKQVYLPESLIESPVFQGSSFDVGESAVVLMNKGKNAAAMKVLKALVGPEHIGKLWSHMLGDKVRSYGICDGVSFLIVVCLVGPRSRRHRLSVNGKRAFNFSDNDK